MPWLPGSSRRTPSRVASRADERPARPAFKFPLRRGLRPIGGGVSFLMASLRIERIREHDWMVIVEGGVATEHSVSVTEDDLERFTGGRAQPEELLRASFEFLLERESNASILRHFALPTIGEYFSDYENEMRRRFAAKAPGTA